MKKNTIQYDFHLREEYELFIKYCKPKKGSKVLEIGSGGGAGLLFLKNQGLSVKGLDIEQKQAKFAEEKSRVKVLIGTAEKIPFKDSSFSFIILSHVLEHLNNPLQAFNEIKRVLKPNGLAFISTPNRYDLYGRLKSFMKREAYIFYKDPTHKTFYTLSQLTEHAKQAGLNIYKSFGKSLFIPLLAKIFPNKKIYRFLGQLPILKYFTTGNIIIAEKDAEGNFDDTYFRSNLNYRGDYSDQEQSNISKAKEYESHILRYKKSGKLLDVACAYGYYMQVFKNNFDVYGFDISKHAINYLKNKYPHFSNKVKVVNGVKEWPYPDNSFDVISAIEVIEHLPNQLAFLNEMHRVLKKNGIVFISTPNSLHRNLAHALSFFFIPDLDKTHISVQSPEKFILMFQNHFEVLEWKYHHHSIGKFWFLEKIGIPMRRILGRFRIFNLKVYFILKKI